MTGPGYCLFTELLQLSSNFSSEVVLLLFDAFAQLEAGEFGNLDVAEYIFDGLFGILDEDLFVEADFLVELVDTAFNHAFDDVSRFAFFFSLLAENFLLVFQSGSINAITVNSHRSCCSDLHSNVLAQLFVATGQVNENADFAAHVDVAGETAFGFVAGETAQGNLFADGSRSFGDQRGNLLAIEFAVVQSIQDLFLVPKIMGDAMGLNPAVILLSLSVWGYLLGFIGLIIALPLTTLVISYYRRFVLEDNDEET